MKPFIGQDVTVELTAATVIRMKNTTMSGPITAADLLPGQYVWVHGSISDGVWTARQINVFARLSTTFTPTATETETETFTPTPTETSTPLP